MTLLELIHECGTKLLWLGHFSNMSDEYKPSPFPGGGDYLVHGEGNVWFAGETAEEAVQKLLDHFNPPTLGINITEEAGTSDRFGG